MRKRTSIVRAKQHVTVPRGHRIHRSASGWDLIDPQGKVAQHFARASALPAEDNPNWVSYSDQRAPLPAINRFVSVWTVPPLPSDGTILIYFFNGLEVIVRPKHPATGPAMGPHAAWDHRRKLEHRELVCRRQHLPSVQFEGDCRRARNSINRRHGIRRFVLELLLPRLRRIDIGG